MLALGVKVLQISEKNDVQSEFWSRKTYLSISDISDVAFSAIFHHFHRKKATLNHTGYTWWQRRRLSTSG